MEWPNKKYKIIYADPPWQYNNQNTGGSMISGSKNQYPTMSVDEIKRLPVPKISDKNSCLFLWVTTPFLPDGIEIMKEWGFNYKTSIYWRKIMSLGMGFWFRGQVEVLLFGIRGNIKAFRSQKCNFIQSKCYKHSQKPKEIYGIIRDISIKFNLNPKIELFAREQIEGWDVWGNQTPNTIQKVLK